MGKNNNNKNRSSSYVDPKMQVRREMVFKELCSYGTQNLDYTTTLVKLQHNLKNKMSRNKVSEALDSLITSKVRINGTEVTRLVRTDGKLSVNPSVIHQDRNGQYVHTVVGTDQRKFYLPKQMPTYAHNEETVSQNLGRSSMIPLNDNGNFVYGKVMKSSGNDLVFIPNDKKRFENVSILVSGLGPSHQDKIVKVELAPSFGKETDVLAGTIAQILGEAGNPIAEYDAIAESHGANMSWDDAKVKAEIALIPTEVDLSQYKLVDEESYIENVRTNTRIGKNTVVDLTHLNFTTTDPATCKDMDDAIYSTRDKDGNFVVYTAVADVTRYVDLNSEIGKRYIKGSFTTYAPNKAYNILPPELSTGICSLNPGVNRLAFVVKTVVSKDTGNPIRSDFMEAVIQSKEKFSYEQAQEIVDTHKEITATSLAIKCVKGEALTREEQVVQNKIASDCLWKGFGSRQLIEFDTNNEYDITFSKDYSKILDITAQPHIDYHKVIEAFMLTANEATAHNALEIGIPNIYRVHDEPNESKVEQATEFFGYLNIPFGDEEYNLTPQGIRNIIELVKDDPSKQKVVNNFLVRMQSKAVYSVGTDPKAENVSGKNNHRGKGNTKVMGKSTNKAFKAAIDEMSDEQTSHFGLQSTAYSHTTSPIRRLPDFLTHFNTLAHIHGQAIVSVDDLIEIKDHTNQMQKENDEAEREFNELNAAIYCEDHINEDMSGRICAFKSLEKGREVKLSSLMAIVENEEKGIRAMVPVVEILGSEAAGKNITLSRFGSAIINAENNKPLLTLCSNVDFRIAEADRITRTVVASTDRTKDFTVEHPLVDISATLEQFGLQDRQKTKGVSHGVIYSRDVKERQLQNARQEKEDLEVSRSTKTVKQFIDSVSDLADEDTIEPQEAIAAAKSAKQMKARQQDKYRANYEDDYEDDFDDDFDDLEEENVEDESGMDPNDEN